jgi:pimeloyl-ACP methyl ester carboxylesterase
MSLERIASADGTTIVVERTGSGRPILLIHGATVDRGSWRALLPHLAGRHEVWAMDRRGRSDSGGAAVYAPEREVEDVLAVLARIGQPVDVFGHSSGAVLALEVAGRSDALHRLVLYEPPLSADGAGPPAGLRAGVAAALAAGDRAEAVRVFYRAGPGITEEGLVRLEAGRAWPSTVAIADTILEDIDLVATFAFDARRIAELRVPTLLLLGERTPARDHRLAAALLAALRDGRLVELPGEGHRAMATAPEMVAQHLLAFLAEA